MAGSFTVNEIETEDGLPDIEVDFRDDDDQDDDSPAVPVAVATTTATTAVPAEATTTSAPRPLFPHSQADPVAARAFLAELYGQHERTVLGLCRLLLHDPAEAEDAAQQTFLSAYRSLLAGNEPEYPAAWLATIARNECWGRVGRRMRQPVPEQLSEELASPLPQPLEAVVRQGSSPRCSLR